MKTRITFFVFALVALLMTPADVNAARLWSSGCEFQGDAPANIIADLEWGKSGGSSASQISTTQKHSGLSSCRIVITSSNFASLAQQFKSADDNGPFYFRFYFYLVTAPGATTDFIDLRATGTTEQTLWINTDKTLELRENDETTVIASYATPLSTNTWYRFDYSYDATGTGAVTIKLDGTTIMSDTTFNGNGIADFEMGLSIHETNTTGEWYFDDIAINDTTGSAQTSYPGPGSIVHMQPDGAGDNSGCTAGDWSSVDEITPDDPNTICTLTTDGGGDILDTTVESSANAGIDSFDTVTLVQVGIGEAAASAASESWNVRVKSASGGTTSSGIVTTHDDTTYRTNGDVEPRNYTLTSYTDPTTGVAWTPTGTNSLDNMQIGANSVDANPDINLTTLWALVEYVDGVAPSLTVPRGLRVLSGKLRIFSRGLRIF